MDGTYWMSRWTARALDGWHPLDWMVGAVNEWHPLDGRWMDGTHWMSRWTARAVDGWHPLDGRGAGGRFEPASLLPTHSLAGDFPSC